MCLASPCPLILYISRFLDVNSRVRDSSHGLPFNPFVPLRQNCNCRHVGSVNILTLDPYSSLGEEEGGQGARWKGKGGCDSRCHILLQLVFIIPWLHQEDQRWGQWKSCYFIFHIIAPDPFWSCLSLGCRLPSWFSFGPLGAPIRQERVYLETGLSGARPAI